MTAAAEVAQLRASETRWRLRAEELLDTLLKVQDACADLADCGGIEAILADILPVPYTVP